MTLRNVFALGLLSVSLVCLSGCGAANVKPSGKVVKGGEPFVLGEKGMFVMSLIPESDAKTNYAVETKPDGTFTVVGPARNGVPPGKYKVAVEAMDPYDKKVDKLGGKFTAAKTSLLVEVKGEKDALVVDVGK